MLHLESNESIEQDEDKEFQVKLQHQLRKALSEPSLLQQLADVVSKGHRSDSASASDDGLSETQSSTGQGSKQQATAAATQHPESLALRERKV